MTYRAFMRDFTRSALANAQFTFLGASECSCQLVSIDAIHVMRRRVLVLRSGIVVLDCVALGFHRPTCMTRSCDCMRCLGCRAHRPDRRWLIMLLLDRSDRCLQKVRRVPTLSLRSTRVV